MGEVTNLRSRRKARQRAAAADQAAANRLRFGRTLEERRLAKAVELSRALRLDGHRIESGEKS
jgi:hypothetical protein